jgi:hypothetical protein
VSFITILTPLTAVPILFGLLIGVWECLNVISRYYGLNLETSAPWLHVSMGSVGAPILLLIVAAFALARGIKLREDPDADPTKRPPRLSPLSLLERASLAGVGLGLVTVPYLYAFPIPEVWAIAAAVLAWLAWRKWLFAAKSPA